MHVSSIMASLVLSSRYFFFLSSFIISDIGVLVQGNTNWSLITITNITFRNSTLFRYNASLSILANTKSFHFTYMCIYAHQYTVPLDGSARLEGETAPEPPSPPNSASVSLISREEDSWLSEVLTFLARFPLQWSSSAQSTPIILCYFPNGGWLARCISLVALPRHCLGEKAIKAQSRPTRPGRGFSAGPAQGREKYKRWPRLPPAPGATPSTPSLA